MTAFAAIDTGSTRNRTAFAIVESKATSRHPAERPLWILTHLRVWRGAPKRPLDHRLVVGPAACEELHKRGIDSLAGDAFEQGPMALVCAERGIRWKVQGGELGPSEHAPTTLGVYEHAQRVIHEERFAILIEDQDAAGHLVRGLQAVQSEPLDGRLKLWVPEEGDDHFDDAVAVMRALWHAKAGNGPPRPLDLRGKFGTYQADGWSAPSPTSDGDGARSRGFEPTW